MMKKIIKLITLVLTAIMTFVYSSCGNPSRDEMIEYYSDEEQYVTVKGEINEVLLVDHYGYGDRAYSTYLNVLTYKSPWMVEGGEEWEIFKCVLYILEDSPMLEERGYKPKVGDQVSLMLVPHLWDGVDLFRVTEFWANGRCYITHEEGKETVLKLLEDNYF